MMNSRFDPWALVLRHIVLPLYYLRHGDKRFRRLKELENNQWMSRAALNALQIERINVLLHHAYDTTSFYRERLDSCGIGAGPIAKLSDLSALQPISKADLQNYGSTMISSSYRNEDLIKDASGGSTGKPTIFYKDPERHNLRRADQIRHDRWTGWNIGDRNALIWGARQDLIDERSIRERFVERYLHRLCSLDAFELSDEKMRTYTDRLIAFQPVMILGYASVLDRFATFLLESGKGRKIKPLGIISSAESLTNEMRERIQKAFGCLVLNRYGSREAGLIASECGSGAGLHINADNLLVEILHDGQPVNPGERGEVVITDFWNFGMPLIRYNMGDRAIAATEECNCGRGLPLMGSIEGRTSDFLTAADGTQIHGEFFTHLFYDEPSVSQFQLIQESMSKVTIKVVPATSRTSVNLDQIVSKTKRVLGGDLQVSVELHDTIPATPSGKFRFTISKLDN